MADESVVVVVESYSSMVSVVEFSDLTSFLKFVDGDCYIFEGECNLGSILWFHEHNKEQWGLDYVKDGLEILKRDPQPKIAYKIRDVGLYDD